MFCVQAALTKAADNGVTRAATRDYCRCQSGV